ncbi:MULTISPECIES: hypothetical protein [unclassified Mesorhizobium]|uniref:hypothetical protein n=1 Tax=unclassified Mesorhizobium TaxID=325217 RepID=UPI0003CFCF8F|nr:MULTISPECIES: hypothetical protein [unclassified Mesorhizobium]ESZ63791.1 hypothetical protein X728_09775 [Mesorhizobium sp. L103C120A0]WJI45211.1 hypothetical protein NL532_00675 [Mesorhizobium sp. C120A]
MADANEDKSSQDGAGRFAIAIGAGTLFVDRIITFENSDAVFFTALALVIGGVCIIPLYRRPKT